MKHKFKLLIILYLSLNISNVVGQDYAYYCTPCNNSCDDEQFSKPGSCTHCGMALEKMTKEEREKQLNNPLTIAFYLQNGVEILDFAGPMEVFAYAGYDVFTVSKTKDPILSQGILKVLPDYSIDDAPGADILAFFGGNSNAAWGDSDVIQWVKNQQDIQYHFSVCTGAFILAESDLLNGKTVTTFHDALEDLRKNYPHANVRDDVRFVDNGKVITTAGISAGIDGALHLVAKLEGIASAKRIAYYMEYDKWLPGEGLILSEENPYEDDMSSFEILKMYEGVYEMDNNQQAELKYDSKSKLLVALVADKKYPLFENKVGEFLTVNKEYLKFNIINDSVTGYTTKDGMFFKKIN